MPVPGAPGLTIDDVLATVPKAPDATGPAPQPSAFSRATPITPPPPAPAPKLTVEDVLGIDQDRDRLTAVAHVGLVQDPARAAKLIDLQGRTGLPTDVIDRNLADVETATRRADFDPERFRQDSPTVASWLAEDPARVGLTRDDLPSLAAVEKLVRGSPAYEYNPDGSISEVYSGGSFATVYRNSRDLRDELIRRGERIDIAQGRADAAAEKLRQDYGGSALLANIGTSFLSRYGNLALAMRHLGGGDNPELRADMNADLQAAHDLAPGFWSGDVVRGVAGLAGDLPLLFAGGHVARAAEGIGEALSLGKHLAPILGPKGLALAAKAATGAATMQPIAVSSALADPHGGGHALASWAIDSGIAGAFGPVGIGRFAAQEAGATIQPMAAELTAAQVLLRHMGLGGGQNLAFDIAHRLHDVASGADPTALVAHNLLPSLALSGILGAGPAAIFAIPEAAQHARAIVENAGRVQVNRITRALHDEDTLRASAEAVNETGAAQLNQSATGDLLGKLASGTPYQTLFVDAKAWSEHFGGQPGDPLAPAREAARLATGDAVTYDKALAANSQIPVPYEKFVPLLADEAHRDFLLSEARTAPEAMNGREARHTAEEATKQAQAQAEAAGPGSRDADLGASADLVHEDVLQQQVAAGVPETTAKRNAEIWRAIMHTAVTRGWAGENVLPHELYQGFKLRVKRGLQDAPVRDALDAMIARLKAGDIPTEADVDRAKTKQDDQTERQDTEDSAAVQRTRDNLLTMLEFLRDTGADVNAETPEALKARFLNAATDKGDAYDQRVPADGLKLTDPEAMRLRAEAEARGELAPTDPNAETGKHQAIADDGSLLQSAADGPRGTFLPARLNATGENVIRILKSADRSTFLHESAHALLEFMHDLAGRDSAPKDLHADLGKLREWLGAKDGEALTRDQHETFARGFERYVMEGKAPSRSLRGAFERFKRWLVAIYQSAKNLHVHLSDDIRAVFDRILASDEEIAQARAESGADQSFFKDQAESGMNDQQWSAYLARTAEGKDRARSLLEREVMAPLVAEDAKGYGEERAKVRLEVADQINQTPAFTALLVLQKGAWPEGVEIPAGAERLKLAKADLVARYGEAALKLLPGPQEAGEPTKANAGRHLYTEDPKGISLDQAAELFGFRDGGELWHALVNAPDRVAAIEAKTDEAMRERRPDPLLDGSLHEKARMAVDNDPRLEAMEREAEAVARRAGRPATPGDLLRAVARAQVDKAMARTLRPGLYRVTRDRATRLAQEAWAKARDATDPREVARLAGEALDHQNNAILQTHLYREATKALERSEKARDYVQGWENPDKRARIGKAGGWEWTVVPPGQGPGEAYGGDAAAAQAAAIAAAQKIPGADIMRTGYLEQADAIREAYDLRRVTDAALARRESLRDFIARKESAGEPIDIPKALVDQLGKLNWRDLTIAQQRDVVDALRNLDHLAKLKNRFLDAKRKETLAESLAAQVATVNEHGRGIKPETAVGRGVLDGALATVRRWWSSMATVQRLTREMDGYRDGGVMFENHLRPANEANARELEMRERSITDLGALMADWYKTSAVAKSLKPLALSLRTFEPAIGKSISHWQRIMVALNWGNADNRARLLQGEGWSERQVHAVMAKLDKADMRFAQGILDHIDSWWPEIKAKQERIVGVAPDKVESLPIIHESGVYRGGYFPIAYDPRSMAHDVELAHQAQLMKRGATMTSTTARGHTEARTGMPDGARLLLDPMVITRHLNNVTHDLAYHEALIDMSRMLRDKDLRAAVVGHWGYDAYQQFQTRLSAMAVGHQTPNVGWESLLSWMRTGTNFANRAFNLKYAITQLPGMLQSLPRVGYGNFARALGGLFRNPAASENTFRWIDEVSPMMRNRSKTRDKNIADQMNGISLRGPVRKTLDSAGYYFFNKVNQLMDSHTWLASYLKAMDEHGGDEAKAFAIADQTVIDIHGSGDVKDIPQAMRGGELGQVFTASMSWWLANYNLTAEIVNRSRGRGLPGLLKAGADLFALYGFQVAAVSGLTAALTGKDDDAWKNATTDPGKLAKILATDSAYTALGSLVLVRELAPVLLQGTPYQGPQGLRSFSTMAGAIEGLKALTDEHASESKQATAAKAIAKATGVVFHLPVAQIVNMAEGLSQANEHGQNPILPFLFGKKPKP